MEKVKFYPRTSGGPAFGGINFKKELKEIKTNENHRQQPTAIRLRYSFGGRSRHPSSNDYFPIQKVLSRGSSGFAGN